MAKAWVPDWVAEQRGGGMSFDIAEIPEARRRDALMQAFDAAYYRCDTSILADELDQGRLSAIDVGAVRAGYGEVGPVVLRRTSVMARRDGGDYIVVPIPLNGPMRFSQRGREVRLEPDGFACILAAEAYTYHQPQSMEFLSLRIRTDALRDRVPHVEDYAGLGFSGRGGIGGLFLDYARAFCRNAAGFDGRTGELAVRQLLDLLVLTFLDAGATSSTEAAVRHAQLQRLLAHVDANLGDPALGAESLAAALALSVEQVEALVADRSGSISNLVRDRRLQEARRLLADSVTPRRSVASIAYSLGFTDPAQFSRLFRRATGDSPTAFRARHARLEPATGRL